MHRYFNSLYVDTILINNFIQSTDKKRDDAGEGIVLHQLSDGFCSQIAI